MNIAGAVEINCTTALLLEIILLGNTRSCVSREEIDVFSWNVIGAPHLVGDLNVVRLYGFHFPNRSATRLEHLYEKSHSKCTTSDGSRHQMSRVNAIESEIQLRSQLPKDLRTTKLTRLKMSWLCQRGFTTKYTGGSLEICCIAWR